jgi:hypothetical protein
MFKTRSALVLLVVALTSLACPACGPKGPTDPIQAPTAKIGKDQCVKMIDHAFDVLAREGDSQAEEKRVMAKHQNSIDQCTREVTRKVYDCVMRSTKAAEVEACGS